MNAPVTLITGASRGIGQAFVEHFLNAGHRVIGCSRSASHQQHPDYRHFCLDVADEKAVLAMMRKIRRELGGVDNLINNAGVATMNHVLLTPMESVRNVFSTNVFGAFLLCREAAKQMMRKRSGRIVSLTTIAVPFSLEGEAAYAASKAAVETLTKVLARELAEHRITVNAVGPTPIATRLIRDVPEEKIRRLVQRQAIPRLGTMEDVINVVDFFLRPESDFVTGQILYLGGVS